VSDTLDSKMAAKLNIIACNLGSKADRNAIPVSNQTFSGSRHPVKILFWTCDVSHIALSPNLYGENKYVIILGGLHTETAALRTIGDPWWKSVDRHFNPGRHCKCRYLWRIPSCISCVQNPQGTSGYCCSFIVEDRPTFLCHFIGPGIWTRDDREWHFTRDPEMSRSRPQYL